MSQENKQIIIHESEFPFIIVEKNGVFNIATNDTIISKESFMTLEEAKQYIESKPYELIINISCYVMEQYQKQDERQIETNNPRND